MKPEVLSAAQVDALMTNNLIPVAHRALWGLMLGYGVEEAVRLTDALSLDVRDVDLDGRTVTVQEPVKPMSRPLVPVSEQTAALLRELSAGRDAGPLIVSHDGRPVSREAAVRMSRAVAGVEVHSFREGGRLHFIGDQSAEHYEECWEELVRGFVCSCDRIRAEHEAYEAEPEDMAARENGCIT
jgi:integrase